LANYELLNQYRPGLNNDDQLLSEVIKPLKQYGDEASGIPWSVWLLENPESPLCMPGAVSLDRHDVLHAILGLGTDLNSECFIVGYTMALDSNLRGWHLWAFQFVSSHIHPLEYQPTEEGWKLFHLGVKLGRETGPRNGHLIPIEERDDQTMSTLRAKLGLTSAKIRAFYTAHNLFQEEYHV
jgi:hypothetical protein